MIQLFKMAFRDLGRNWRRSFFSALAVGMALALLLLFASFIQGEIGMAIDTAIRLQSGHLQVRAKSYDESKTSLKWEDLVRGDFLPPDDREGMLIGKPLAEKLGLKVGDSISLSVNTSNGDVDEQPFTIRGIYSTKTNGFDSAIVFLPLAKAQAFTQAGNHASTVFVLLKDSSQTDAVVAALQNPNYQVLTWAKMNELIVQYEDLANSYMVFFYLIVLGISATVIINTLIMSVFERTREIGILAAIGMKGRRIMALFLAESTLLAIGGI